MSADDGIYIGHFADGEIRVIHAQAIDNLWYPKGNGENAKAIVDYFKNAEAFVFNDLIQAEECAFNLEDEILASDYPVLEYGIGDIVFFKSFKEYEEAAKLNENS